MKNAKQVLNHAEDVACRVETWADLSNALFNPIDGLLTTAYPSRAEREEFVKTEQYKRVRGLLTDAIGVHGLVEGATPKKSGRFVVRLPESLHLALEQE